MKELMILWSQYPVFVKSVIIIVLWLCSGLLFLPLFGTKGPIKTNDS